MWAYFLLFLEVPDDTESHAETASCRYILIIAWCPCRPFKRLHTLLSMYLGSFGEGIWAYFLLFQTI